MKLIANLAPLDQQAAITYGIPGVQLMEAAGQAVATLVQSLLQDHARQTLILCGLGNNGGDGFVCARMLYEAGFPATLLTEFTPEGMLSRLKGDALHNAQRIAGLPLHWLSLEDNSPEVIQTTLQEAHCIVDGLLGSGLSRPITGTIAQLIQTINALPPNITSTITRHVVAIDLPSGVDGATGQLQGAEALQATHTLTLACPKPGLFLSPGKASAGIVSCADIGLPESLIADDPSPLSLITPAWAAETLPKRKPDGHKYDFGHVLVIGGCQRMPGAVSLAALAALRSGCGIVTMASLPGVLNTPHIPPEVVQLPLNTNNKDYLDSEAAETLLLRFSQADSKPFDAILFGPGLGLTPESKTFAEHILTALLSHYSDKAVIIDADALTLLAQLQAEGLIPQRLPESWILTPHVGEFCRVAKQEKDIVLRNLPEAALDAAKILGCTIVLKSASTVIAGTLENTPHCLISPTGDSGMATAGSGDVLAGLIAGLSAQAKQNNTHLNNAGLGVYLHGLAGMTAAQHKTAYCTIASDMIEAFPAAFHQLLGQTE